MYKNFLAKFAITVALIVILVQTGFIIMSIKNARRGVDELDLQMLASFKSAIRSYQESVHYNNDTFDYSGGNCFQLASDNRRFYQYYYKQVSPTSVERSDEFNKYCWMIDNNMILYDGSKLFQTDTSGEKMFEKAGFVPMDYALPYLQLFPISGSKLLPEESVTLKRQDGADETMQFDTDLVSQTKKTLLKTLSANYTDGVSNNSSSSLVAITDASDTGVGIPSTDGIPDIKMTLMYFDSRDADTYQPELKELSNINDLERVLHFTTNSENSVNKHLGPVLSGSTDAGYFFTVDPNNPNPPHYYITPYYDLYLKVEYTAVAKLFAFTQNHDTFYIRVPVEKYYHVRYSLLS